MKNTISIISRTFMVVLIGLVTVTSALAHPGHGLLNQDGEGIEHFVTSPYHLAIGLVITVVLAVVLIKFRKSIILAFNRNKK
jgi:heme A synthase